MVNTRTSRATVAGTEAEPQAQHTSEVVSIRNLQNDRGLYDNYPKFQRGFVWPDKFKRALIDSILRGFPVHPLLTYKALDEQGAERFQVIDGHQRLSTVYEYLDGQFATATLARGRSDEPSSLPPIEPGRRFNELDERAKNLFLGYKFTVNIMKDDDETMLGMIFRRVQHQLPLTMAEKLASYRSRAKDFALKLTEHPIWQDCYIGNDKRKETLQGSLSLISLEMAQDYIAVDSNRLHILASGAKDTRITPEFCEALESRLDVVMHVFDGTTFTHRAEVIPMYQAIMFLERQGRKFTSSDKGCLTPWFGQVLYEAEQEGRHGFAYSLARMIEHNKQYDFWEIHLPRIAEQCKGNAA